MAVSESKDSYRLHWPGVRSFPMNPEDRWDYSRVCTRTAELRSAWTSTFDYVRAGSDPSPHEPLWLVGFISSWRRVWRVDRVG